MGLQLVPLAWVIYATLSITLSTTLAVAQVCGLQAGGALCSGGQCCSQYGYCGKTSEYCGPGCQSQCGGAGNVASIVSEVLFNNMLKYRNSAACPANNFYSYSSFIAAASWFPKFAGVGDVITRKREIAAFLAQTSHETTGGSSGSIDYAWGYCFKEEIDKTPSYCATSPQWPCVSGKKYYGRGPIQISWNYNYGPAGSALGVDLLSNPDLVATDATVSFKTAFWFWMTPQTPKPSCHNVMTGGWKPSGSDVAAGRLPGYGTVTNIINGGLECGHGPDTHVADRIGYYKRYCTMLGVDPGVNLDCGGQKPFGSSVSDEDQHLAAA